MGTEDFSTSLRNALPVDFPVAMETDCANRLSLCICCSGACKQTVPGCLALPVQHGHTHRDLDNGGEGVLVCIAWASEQLP